MLVRKIQKQTNQLVVNIPRQICEDFGWQKGDFVRVFVVARGVIQIEKITPERGEYKRPRQVPGDTGENKSI